MPRGALKQADNCILDREGLLEKRPGFRRYNTNLFANAIEEYATYKGVQFAYDPTSGSVFVDDGVGGFVNTGAGEADPTDLPAGLFFDSTEANGNLYFTTDDGIKKFDTATTSSTPEVAGIPKGLDLDGSLSSAGSGWFNNNNNVAYRVVWGKFDANGNLLLGSPSERFVISNTSGSDDTVDLTFTIPQPIVDRAAGNPTAFFWQLYRSSQSGGSAILPDDELQLVAENNPTVGELGSGIVSYTDNVPDDIRGANLYTNASEQGAENVNDVPPRSDSIKNFRNFTFYGGATLPATGNLTVIAVGPTLGLQLGDTITINGTPYTAAAAENIGAQEFELFTAGTPGQNIENTCLSIVRVFNRQATTQRSFLEYNSLPTATPGEIFITDFGIEATPITVTSSRPSAFLFGDDFPRSFSAETFSNRLYYSKADQPESVPPANFESVGSSNTRILRVEANRDHLFVWKEEAVFRVSGTTPPFRVDILDDTVRLVAPRSVQVLANEIYAVTDQGVVAVSGSGVSIVSRPVEVDILKRITDEYNPARYCFGVAYQSARQYQLYLQSETTDTAATQAFVYNYINRGWTRWLGEYYGGYVNIADGKQYLTKRLYDPADGIGITQERKTQTQEDFADEQFPVTIVSFTNDVVELTGLPPNPLNFTLKQGAQASKIIAVLSSTEVQVEVERNWDVTNTTPAFVFEPYIMEWTHVPEDCQNPAMNKMFNGGNLFFDDASFSIGDLSCRTSYNAQYVGIRFFPRIQNSLSEWGIFQWGKAMWGSSIIDEFKVSIPFLFPFKRRYSQWMIPRVTVNQAFTSVRYGGYSINYRNTSRRQRA